MFDDIPLWFTFDFLDAKVEQCGVANGTKADRRRGDPVLLADPPPRGARFFSALLGFMIL
jgi:hypothetical protein